MFYLVIYFKFLTMMMFKHYHLFVILARREEKKLNEQFTHLNAHHVSILQPFFKWVQSEGGGDVLSPHPAVLVSDNCT